MIDNAYNRNKMRGFVMGLEAAKHMVQADDDVEIFQAQVDERIEEICEDWNIKPPVPEGDGDDTTTDL